VTRIVSMSARDRRGIIDELAGVALFDSRIDQTRGKLDEVQERQGRCSIVQQELLSSRQKLERDCAKARTYQDLRQRHHTGRLHEQVLAFEAAQANQAALERRRDGALLRGARVIGCTTTGAARNRRLLETVAPSVLVVEEAAEVLEAVAAARGAGNTELVVLHCNSGYPSPVSDIRLSTIAHLRALTGCAIGLSDHTLGTTAAIAAVALGAVVIEKHITLKRADGGPDASFSLEPAELAELVRSCREAHAAIGAPRAGLSQSEAGNIVFRRSLFAVEDIAAGAPLTPQNVRSIRPGYGLAPKLLPRVLGRRAAAFIPRGTPLSWALVEGGEG
jgi:hypothetical protein